MALSEAALKKLSKDEIVSLILDYENKFDSLLVSIRNKLSDLKKDFEGLGSDLSVATIINGIFETNSSFCVKYQNQKILISIFQGCFGSVNKLSFWRGGCAVGYHSMGFIHFPGIS